MPAFDPLLLTLSLSGLAACFALVAACRPRRADPALAERLDEIGRELAILRGATLDELRRARVETGAGAREMREELGAAMARLGAGQGARMEAVADRVGALAEGNERRLAAMRRDGDEAAKALREEVVRQLGALADLLTGRLGDGAEAQKERLDAVEASIRRLVGSSAEANEALRRTVESRLETLRGENAAKLEEMRRTVDEKLQGTLEERLGEKFKLVSHHLEQVHASVGEMRHLASGVGDLKRVLANVKTRGTWAEVSLGALLEEVLAPDQFGRNVETVRGSGERVEYAVRFPGRADGESVWLPIDAKFPVEDYERLVDAAERADAAGMETAGRALEARIRLEGAKIARKYLSAPATTDFAVLYLPTEGLYAEVLRRPGLVDHLRVQCRITVAGPTTLHAFLNSLRLGFRTLAIERRSGEVWTTLAAVKTEFGRYGEVLDAVRKKLGEATLQIDRVAVRKRAIDRHLAAVETAEAGTRPYPAEPADRGSGPEHDLLPDLLPAE